jgi:CRP-like cAMP-binding protein
MTEDFLGLFRKDPDVIFLKPAQELFKKGEPGSHMYVVKSGEVQVVDGNHVFETISSGGIVGSLNREQLLFGPLPHRSEAIIVSCAANSVFLQFGLCA